MPFYLGAFGALLTAFYMTRQVFYVFFGEARLEGNAGHGAAAGHSEHGAARVPHESPAAMTMPLVLLASCAVLLGLIGTPAWPWFNSFLNGQPAALDFAGFLERGTLPVMLSSTIIVFLGLGLGWWFYGRRPIASADAPDALEQLQPGVFRVLQNKFYVDELYGATVIRWNGWLASLSDWMDRWIFNGAVQAVSYLVIGLSWMARSVDVFVVNPGFDGGCKTVTVGGKILARLQNGRTQAYLRMVGLAFAVLIVFLIWSGRR